MGLGARHRDQCHIREGYGEGYGEGNGEGTTGFRQSLVADYKRDGLLILVSDQEHPWARLGQSECQRVGDQAGNGSEARWTWGLRHGSSEFPVLAKVHTGSQS
jgi:hypothetical protein